MTRVLPSFYDAWKRLSFHTTSPYPSRLPIACGIVVPAQSLCWRLMCNICSFISRALFPSNDLMPVPKLRQLARNAPL
jgi:hypothetical protein